MPKFDISTARPVQSFDAISANPLVTEDILAKMDWDTLEGLRYKYANYPKMQKFLAPFEHRAYAREDVAASPLKALTYPALIPGYQAAKIAGLIPEDTMSTPASLKQVTEGFTGVGEGLANYASTLLNK